jgi:hypothetical protein
MGVWGEVIGEPKAWARALSLALFVGLALAFIGPFGSYDMPLETRLLTCLGYGLAGSFAFWPALRLGLLCGARIGLPPLFAKVAAVALATVPVTGVVILIRPLLAPGAAPPISPASLYLSVLALVLPLGLAVLLVGRWAIAPAEASSGPAEAAADTPPRLLERLPPKTRGELVALQAEDHYVRVHTRAGDALILMRLADAIAETDGEPGLQPHRSWWVAKAAVTGARAEGRRGVLSLANGLDVPVTRDLMPEIRRAGWL